MATAELPAPKVLRDYDPLVGSTLRKKAALAAGASLLLITVGLCYVAWGDLPESVDRPNLPPNLFAAFAFCFFGAPGLYLAILGALDLLRDAYVRRAREIHPDEPWQWDYRWRPGAARDVGLQQAAKGLLALTLGVGILAPINFIFAGEANSAMFILPFIVLGLFDLLLLISLGTVVYRIAAQLVHNNCRLTLDQFPLRLGETAELTLFTHSAFDSLEELTCTLRCVEETCQARRGPSGTSDPRRTKVVTKIALQHYCDERTATRDALHGEALSLAFDLPNDAVLRTRLSEIPSLHWELSVTGKCRGINLAKRFLLPVY